MVIANFTQDEKTKYVEGLDQYDYGQVLRIQGLNLPTAVEIHFGLDETGGTTVTRIGTTKNGVTDVPIPDSMLENEDIANDYSIYAFVYLTDDTSGQTEYKITLKVKARPKPEVPGGGDNPDIFHEAVEAVRESMEAAAESEKQAEGWAHGREDLPERAQDNAKYYSEQAREDSKKTYADRKEVERLVESVSGIEEQVGKVNELTKQAQKSATDAGLYKEAAESARRGAETAKTEAETAAGKTAEDKTAVETAKGEVLKAQEAVSTDRKAVESIKSGIEQLGGEIAGTVEQGMQEISTAKQQAVQAIEQTGTDQKNAVEASGTKAVQSVEVAQQTATEAIETAKSEAVQAVQTEGTTQAGNVSAEGEKQVQAVQGAAQEIMADREQIQENKTGIAKLKEDLGNILSPNLYNPAAAKANVAISSGDGSEMDGFSGWESTDYIPVSKNDVLYFSANNEPIHYSTGSFYDAQKKFIGGFGNPNSNNNITVTSDGYARFSFDAVRANLQIEKGSRTTYIPYGKLKIKADVDNIKKDTGNIKAEVSGVKAEVVKIQEDHSNLFNKDTVVKGAVLAENGYFDSSFTSWDSSDYIPVKPGTTLYFSSNQLPIGAASTGAYFDADKKYLSGINNEPTVLTVPDGAYYLRFSKNEGLGDTLNTLKIEQHGITKFTPYGELYVTVNESALPSSIFPKWKGLKILTLGDSITAMGGVNGWTHWIKQYLLADKVVNVSVAGSTWQDKVANQTYDGNPQPSTDGNVMGNQVQKVLNAKANGDVDYQDFDVITFSFGTNDSVDFSVQTKESVENQFITNYAQNNFTVVPLESVNRQTLAGAMRYGFQKLHEAYPNAVIFMCTPTQECYETFDSIYQKGDFINFVADRCGAETIDTRRCGIRNIYESQTTIEYDHPDQSGVAPIQTDLLDGMHTNENGAKKIAKYNAREIMKYFMIN